MILFLLLSFSASLFASTPNHADNNYAEADSLNLMVEFSLFYEYHKNKDYASAEPHGWNIVHSKPENFLQFKPFHKMEDILWYLHDSTDITEEQKLTIADTTIYLYNRAMEVDKDKAPYFQIKKAFVMEIWKDLPAAEVIAEYVKAFEMDPNAPTFYKDRLGRLYKDNAADDNEYKLLALDLYSNLSEADPNNEIWIQMIESLAENPEELMDITKRAWELDKENLEKAWKYASLCLRNKEYTRAIEALEFLVGKSPDVINYWMQLSSAYDKTDQTDKTISAYKKLISLQPDNRDNYANLALVYKKMDQLSVARSYLQKASNIDPDWDFPYFVEAQIYEQAARNCIGSKFEFIDKVVYQLAVDTYKIARSKGGQNAGAAGERMNALKESVPQQEDFFFRNIKSGEKIKIEGKCYDWIGRTVIVP
ncbi:MAG: hypothetical protein KJ571_10250 [Bacteroidetes bacterium]|nr:hypothetical protein [Bacteroidota bacterium]